mmetsp:Transcript_6357/g.25427  ORF Transcript_6357/g.25427 Transcript_6357/m.25427 type:complete len:241 (+) Transcript_6357:6885-7607(+)
MGAKIFKILGIGRNGDPCLYVRICHKHRRVTSVDWRNLERRGRVAVLRLALALVHSQLNRASGDVCEKYEDVIENILQYHGIAESSTIQGILHCGLNRRAGVADFVTFKFGENRERFASSHRKLKPAVFIRLMRYRLPITFQDFNDRARETAIDGFFNPRFREEDGPAHYDCGVIRKNLVFHAFMLHAQHRAKRRRRVREYVLHDRNFVLICSFSGRGLRRLVKLVHDVCQALRRLEPNS